MTASGHRFDEVTTGPSSCPNCRTAIPSGGRYCEACGTRVAGPRNGNAQTPVPPEQVARTQIDLGAVAAVSDRGRRRRRNEDAVKVLADNGRALAVVCDGVASTTDAHQASQTAARAAATVLRPLLTGTGFPPREDLDTAFDAAVLAAQAEVASLVDTSEPSDLSPSTTLVAALAGPGHLAVGGMGDSRAYWLTDAPENSRLLTVDDSWAQDQIAAGADPQVAFGHPEAHTITRWIGAGADPGGVAVAVSDVSEPGLLVLCSDGLWNYFDEPDRLTREAGRSSDRSAIGIARHLVRAALELAVTTT